MHRCVAEKLRNRGNDNGHSIDDILVHEKEIMSRALCGFQQEPTLSLMTLRRVRETCYSILDHLMLEVQLLIESRSDDLQHSDESLCVSD